MEIRTENLTILFVDIAGFTATTSRQSRAENAKLLQTFNSTLLPLIKRFKGIVVKSIGDALLLTFRSPTDAMLCAMALQDAMHAHNLNAGLEDKIHIRVAANLGEVRITKQDIFGEPVNVASRIEGVTPADEIYLSEAVYMAMNKAEVPAQEAGTFELAGVSGALRLYSIPRFATPRLVPQQLSPQEQGNELLFPYGGMHQRLPDAKRVQLNASTSSNLKRLAIALISLSAIGSGVYWWQQRSEIVNVEPNSALSSVSEIKTSVVAAKVETAPLIEPAKELPPIVSVDAEKLAAKTSKTETSTVVIPVAKPVVETKTENITKPLPEPAKAAVTEKPVTKAHDVVEKKPDNKPVIESSPIKTLTPSDDEFSAPWNVAKLKRAYRAEKISKPEYRKISEQLENDYEQKIREIKQAYRAKQMSKEQYGQAVREAKKEYTGN